MQAPPPLPRPDPATHRRRGTTVALLLGAGILAAALFVPRAGLTSGPDLRGAWTICKQFVEPKLAAPSSATFASFDEADVFDLTGGQIRAIGYVDAQNAYGARLRSRFTCTVTPLGGTRWRLNTLVFDKTP